MDETRPEDSGDRQADALARRDFLRLVGASLALPAAVSCTSRPRDRILPYVEQPPEVTPGRPSWFATSMSIDGYGTGLLVESHEGRPTKIEGHPEHPASLGAADIHAQASVLDLYDPDRARGTHDREGPASFERFAEAFAIDGAEDATSRGAGLHFLLEPTSSPLIGFVLERLAARRPEAQVHFHASLGQSNRWDGTRAAFGRVLEARPDLRRAQVVVALDEDFLGFAPHAVRLARDFSSLRRVRSASDSMSRLYVSETNVSVTGTKADHRLSRKPSEFLPLARALLSSILGALPRSRAESIVPGTLAEAPPLDEEASRWVRAAARDLVAHAGEGVVLVADGLSPAVHAVVHAMNAVLGNAGATISYAAPPQLGAGTSQHGIERLAHALQHGEVDRVVILEGNPVYTAPGWLDLAARLRRARLAAYLGLYENETAAECSWFLHGQHYLESWGDTRSQDGTVSFVQPLLSPLYDGISAVRVLAAFAGLEGNERSLLMRYWLEHGVRDEAAFRDALQRGLLPETAFAAEKVRCDFEAVGKLADAQNGRAAAGLELNVVRDARVLDGRFSNNAFLQELPEPVTHLSWGNAALVGARTAKSLAVENGRLVRVRTDLASVELPALVVPGHAEGTLTVALGYGRSGAERVARRVGTSVSALLEPPSSSQVTVEVLGGSVELALQRRHPSQEGRDIARTTNLELYRRRPAATERREPRSLYYFARDATEQWAMSIDLTACTGCSACVIACQVENNVPVVGRDWVLRAREMHWIRIDRYVTGSGEEAAAVFQPMLCQHCEKAPCEYVCPVGATTHSDEGLNEMTYNRCVGTRFCSNNCPYKVRRFNYLNYNAGITPTERLSKNPSVTVRDRGVMEKCTYCVQRIRAAEIHAAGERRRLRHDEVTTACQQTCPSGAIVFGSLTAKDSQVARLARSNLRYDVLGELGTRPRTTYLEALRNPNPDYGSRT